MTVRAALVSYPKCAWLAQWWTQTLTHVLVDLQPSGYFQPRAPGPRGVISKHALGKSLICSEHSTSAAQQALVLKTCLYISWLPTLILISLVGKQAEISALEAKKAKHEK